MKRRNLNCLDACSIFVNNLGSNRDFCSVAVTDPEKMENFYQWFVGFSDGESSFGIVPVYSESGKVIKFSFRFAIVLHIDDKDALITIHNLLAVGNVSKRSESEYKFSVTGKEGIRKLISIFDKYNLNTTKYLDYLDFKEAFNLYYNRDGVLTEELKGKIMKLKNGMNSDRTNFNMPSDHIKVTAYWLLGLVEGEGSFHLWRSDVIPAFAIALTENQRPVLEKIKEFFVHNLGFDSYSIWRLNNTPVIGINTQKARNNSKGSVLIIIKDIRILHNFIVPFFEGLRPYFLSKKAQDFDDFKLMCRAVYYGVHKKEPVRSLILKLSRSMNNFRLSNYSGKIPRESITKNERDVITNASPLVEHLWDGRLKDLASASRQKIIHQNESSVYKVIKPSGEEEIIKTLTECAKIVGVDTRTLSKHLDVDCPVNSDYTALIKNHRIKRIRVYYK